MRNLEYKATVLEAMSEVLRPAGFRKRGLVFHRSVADVVHLVSLQSSQASTAVAVRLTVNVAVWVPGLARARDPDIWSAHWRQRLGHLMPEPRDRWWRISCESDALSASCQIRMAIAGYAVPALDALSSSEALVSLWQSGRSPGLTRAQAERCLRELTTPPSG